MENMMVLKQVVKKHEGHQKREKSTMKNKLKISWNNRKLKDKL